jgi:succinate dehydrogenase/fumarate reductase flavoprotein subunit
MKTFSQADFLVIGAGVAGLRAASPQNDLTP